jgi:hypothetical protein
MQSNKYTPFPNMKINYLQMTMCHLYKHTSLLNIASCRSTVFLCKYLRQWYNIGHFPPCVLTYITGINILNESYGLKG